MYEKIDLEVENLKRYVNQDVEFLGIPAAREHLGKLYQAVDYCRILTVPKHYNIMVNCLTSARLIIHSDWYLFMSSIPGELGTKYTFPSIEEVLQTLSKLEGILPFWRHDVDILVSVDMELISSNHHAESNSGAELSAADLIGDVGDII